MGINRNIVECKEAIQRWDDALAEVLIETLWNVKFSASWYAILAASINRNIVECKVARAEYHTRNEESCINRNIVECKDHQPIVEAFGAARINRNIVECKAVS